MTTVSLPRVTVYIPQIEDSSQCILDGTVPIIAGEHGRDNVAVVEAAVTAARARRTLSVRRVEGS